MTPNVIGLDIGVTRPNDKKVSKGYLKESFFRLHIRLGLKSNKLETPILYLNGICQS